MSRTMSSSSVAEVRAPAPARSVDLRREGEDLFRAPREAAFEDGVESDFSKTLVSLVRQHGRAMLDALADLVMGEPVHAEPVGEALRWLGHMDDPDAHDDRLRLLLQSLDSNLPQVRDAAGLGLAFLDDPRAAPSLRAAADSEPSPQLRNDLREIAEQLEGTPLCL